MKKFAYTVSFIALLSLSLTSVSALNSNQVEFNNIVQKRAYKEVVKNYTRDRNKLTLAYSNLRVLGYQWVPAAANFSYSIGVIQSEEWNYWRFYYTDHWR
ncbi:MAG: hypothetical protein LBV67_11310 [Streptococcaceae bacterium]|jgi:hypothetical protein|nr:hypothetical protein [Streptococcaceae bacterium]